MAKEKGYFERYPDFYGETPMDMLMHSITVSEEDSLLYSTAGKALKNVIDEEAEKESIKVQDEDKTFIATFYRYSFVGIIQNWIEEGMKESPKEIIEKLSKILDGSFKKALYNLSNDR